MARVIPRFSRRRAGLNERAPSDLTGLTLPRNVVGDVGLRTRKNNIRYDLAVLARAARLWDRFKGCDNPISFEYQGQFFTEKQHPLEFVASFKSMVRVLYARLFKCAVIPDKSVVGHSSFNTFFEARRKEVNRRVLKTGLLRDLGHAASEEHVPGKARDLFGKRWSMAGTSIDEALPEAREDAPLPLVFCSLPPDEQLLTTAHVPVLSYYEQLVAFEHEVHLEFTHAITRTSLSGQRGRKANWFTWQKRQSRNVKDDRHEAVGARHISIGAFRPREAKSVNDDIRQRRACIMPYLVAEIDGKTARSSMRYADLLVERLKALGADLSKVIVSYSGNRSFHVRIPMGMVGNPVFRDALEAQRIVRQFFQLITDGLEGEEGPLFKVLDANKFSPNTLIRAIGSLHEKTQRWCVGYKADVYLDVMPLGAILFHSEHYSPFTIRHPAKARSVPELVSALQLAAEPDEISPGVIRTNRGIIAAIEEGVTKGAEFAPGYVGRNYAALLYAANLLQRYPEAGAWELLEAWNLHNTPPLGMHPEDDRNELRRQFDRALRRVYADPARRGSVSSRKELYEDLFGSPALSPDVMARRQHRRRETMKREMERAAEQTLWMQQRGRGQVPEGARLYIPQILEPEEATAFARELYAMSCHPNRAVVTSAGVRVQGEVAEYSGRLAVLDKAERTARRKGETVQVVFDSWDVDTAFYAAWLRYVVACGSGDVEAVLERMPTFPLQLHPWITLLSLSGAKGWLRRLAQDFAAGPHVAGADRARRDLSRLYELIGAADEKLAFDEVVLRAAAAA